MPLIEILNPQTLIPDVQSSYTINNGTEEKIDLNDDTWATEYFVLFFHTGPQDPVSTFTLKSVDKRNDTGPDALTCKVIGVSLDTTHALFDWLDSDPELTGFDVPLMSDRKASICRQFGVLQQAQSGDQVKAGYPANSVFIIDSQDRVRYHCVLDSRVAFNVGEIARLVRAFQATDGGKSLAMADWKGEEDTVLNRIPNIKHYYGTKYGSGKHVCSEECQDMTNDLPLAHGPTPLVQSTGDFGTAKDGKSATEWSEISSKEAELLVTEPEETVDTHPKKSDKPGLVQRMKDKWASFRKSRS